MPEIFKRWVGGESRAERLSGTSSEVEWIEKRARLPADPVAERRQKSISGALNAKRVDPATGEERDDSATPGVWDGVAIKERS